MDKVEVATVGKCGDVTVIKILVQNIIQDIDIQDIWQVMEPVVSKQGFQLLIDMSDVGFMSSAMLGKILTAEKRMREFGGTVKICGLNEAIIDVFRITRMDRILPISGDSADDVLAAW